MGKEESYAMSKRDKFHGRIDDGVTRPCDWPDCEATGVFRAPRQRETDDARPGHLLEGGLEDHIDDSRWFCLQHVREYNADWDYFDGMSEDEINAFRDEDASWHRPTWSAANPGELPGAGQNKSPDQPWTGTGPFADPHRLFPNARGNGAGGDGAAAKGFNRPMDLPDLKALNALGLEEGASVTEIKASYKRLAKQHHPDLNNGDAASGKQLRLVIEAYNRLSGAFADC